MRYQASRMGRSVDWNHYRASLRQTALPSLVEMARWKTGHAYMPFFLLGRVAGIPEDEIAAAWERGDRAAFIDAAVKRTQAK
jgi:hypothetical protein